VLDDDVAHVDWQRAEQRNQLAPLGGREASGGLVEQNEARRPGQRHANLELSLLAMGQRRDGLIGHR
jgi:hypothetical protein